MDAVQSPKGIVVRDQVSPERSMNTDFLYSPFKGGQSVFQGAPAMTGRKLQIPYQPNLKVVVGLPTQPTFRKAV